MYLYVFFFSKVPALVATSSVADPQFDGVVIVTDKISKLDGSLGALKSVLHEYTKVLCCLSPYDNFTEAEADQCIMKKKVKMQKRKVMK